MPGIDLLVITHDHWDHLDYGTVTKLRDRTGRVVCPLGVGEYFEYWGFDPQRITELDWGEQAALGGGFTVYCRPARHFSGRTFRANRTLWASFVVETPSQRIFLGGDAGTIPISPTSHASFRIWMSPCSKTASTARIGAISTCFRPI